ncbi:MFS transporter [Allokutzneria albata]|uniref:Multidrug resistance protein n=1 Tax=Allokutzneria albata TaxID=211114 RepID=A0A1G9YQC2_ALLAB|nr:MFS transporter [Allokutzneria albata]SDN10775.1 Multidrug resistance protein [Allokutzneria albata]
MKKSTAATVASVAIATDMFAYGVAIPVLPRIAGTSPAQIGVLFAVYAATMLIATPLVGRVVDRHGTRKPMLVGLFGLAAATLLFAFAQSFTGMLVARALQGVAAAVSWTAGLALIAATHEPEVRGKVMGIALSSMSIGVLMGPIVGGLLADLFGTSAPFLCAAAVAFVDGLLRIFLVQDTETVREDSPKVWRHPATPALFGVTALGAGLIAFLEAVLPLRVVQGFGASPTTIGVLFAIATLVCALAAPIAGNLADRLPRIALAIGGAALAAVGLLIVAVAGSIWLTGVGLTVVAAGGQFVLAPTLTLIAELADAQSPPAYGAAYALYSVAYTNGLLVAPLLAGIGADVIGFTGILLTAAVLAVALALVLRPASRQG